MPPGRPDITHAHARRKCVPVVRRDASRFAYSDVAHSGVTRHSRWQAPGINPAHHPVGHIARWEDGFRCETVETIAR
jgi:hypothetical protein